MVKYTIVNSTTKWLQSEPDPGGIGGDDVGFHNVLFPEGVQYGTSGGPGFRTTIVPLDSGGEERVGRWPRSRRVYDAVHNIKRLEDLSEILTFFEARKGALNGFRFKDWNDYSTASDHRGTPAATDVYVATGDGTTASFQLVKRYTSGTQTVVRTIRLPLTSAWGSTPLVAYNGGTRTYGTDFTVNDVTGELLCTTIPNAGSDITWGGYYHVPVRFGEEADRGLQMAIDSFSSGSLPEVPLVELMDSLLIPEDYYHGGAYEYNGSADISVNPAQGRAIYFGSSVGTITVYIPNAVDLTYGGPWFHFFTAGSTTVTIKDQSGNTVTSVNTSVRGRVLYIFKESGLPQWRAI